MNMKNAALLLLLCLPNLIKSETAEKERIFSDSTFELKAAYASWVTSLDFHGANFACKTFVRNRCSDKEPKECENLFMECLLQSFYASSKYKKYCELHKLHENREEPGEPRDRSQSIFAHEENL